MRKQYRDAVKQKNLSRSFFDMGKQLRQELDQAGGGDKVLVLAGDGSFCNRTCLSEIPEKSVLLVRARKDARLCFRAAEDSRRFYAAGKFTPQQVRKDESRAFKTTKIFYGGKRRMIPYKEVSNVFRQRGAGQRPLRLIIAPTPDRKTKSKKLYSRDPAYLLTSDLRSSLKRLLQIYFDRWQIEVNHREEKDTLGVGPAQLWNVTSVPKQPILAVASYSALLASLVAFGAERGNAYAALPKWRRNARRPSCLDLITLLRKEMAQQPHLLAPPASQSPIQPWFRLPPPERNVETPAPGFRAGVWRRRPAGDFARFEADMSRTAPSGSSAAARKRRPHKNQVRLGCHPALHCRRNQIAGDKITSGTSAKSRRSARL